MSDITAFIKMGPQISDAELRRAICWDDDEDQDLALGAGRYVTCAGEWRREQNGDWQFYKDPEVEI